MEPASNRTIRYHYPAFEYGRDSLRLVTELTRDLTRETGFEAVRNQQPAIEVLPRSCSARTCAQHAPCILQDAPCTVGCALGTGAAAANTGHVAAAAAAGWRLQPLPLWPQPAIRRLLVGTSARPHR